ncbi:MAG TPA: hypothetical protein PKD34_03340, partial [Candidatus Doudnabacteria bacterium]|nr:hypothetical protein [Candidatus Doudnabacteria bacterium]
MSPNSFDGIQVRKSSARPKSFGVFVASAQETKTQVTESFTTKTVVYQKSTSVTETVAAPNPLKVQPV